MYSLHTYSVQKTYKIPIVFENVLRLQSSELSEWEKLGLKKRSTSVNVDKCHKYHKWVSMGLVSLWRSILISMQYLQDRILVINMLKTPEAGNISYFVAIICWICCVNVFLAGITSFPVFKCVKKEA